MDRIMSIDKIGFAQMVLFGFPFGRRTLVKGKPFPDVLPKHLNYLTPETDFVEQGEEPSLARTLKKCISGQLSELSNSAVFMSAGYDSRLVLSGVLSSGAKPDLITYYNRSTSSELGIVRRIAEECDLTFIPCEDRDIEKREFEDHLSTYLRDSIYVSNPVRLMYYSQAMSANIKSDGLFSGEGETFRLPGFPSEYLTRGAIAAIRGDEINVPHDCIFIDLPWKEAIHEVEYSLSNWDCKLGEMGKIHKWFTEHAYPKIYGSMAMAFGSIAPVYLPLLKPEFVRGVAVSEFGIPKHSNMQSNVWDLWKSKKVYCDIVGELHPALLSIPTDRGYKPLNDGSFSRYILSNASRKMRSMVPGKKLSFAASKGAFSYRKFLFEKLESELSSIPFIKRDLLKSFLDYKDVIDGHMIHSLSQVLILTEMIRTGHV